MSIGAASGFAAAAVGLIYMMKYRHLRLRVEAGRIRFSIDGTIVDSNISMAE